MENEITPETAATLHNLAGVYNEQGKYTEAEPLYKRALAIYEQKLGPDHPDTVKVRNNLADLYKRQSLERPQRNVPAEASSSWRASELTSLERSRFTDRHTDGGRSEGERRPKPQLGGYRLVERLGGGAFADVYRGEPLDPNEPQVAIKVLRVRPVDSDLERFCQEAMALKKLKHENIVNIYNFGVENDIPYLMVEFAPHGTLELPKNTRLSPEKAVEYLDQIAEAIDFAHSKGLIHRDIKLSKSLLEKRKRS